MKHVPWESIRREFERGKLTCRELAEKYGVGYSTVTEHARREDWEVNQQPALARQLSDIVRQALESEQQEEKPDIRRVKDLMGLLRELGNLDKAQEDRPSGEDVVRVVLAPEVEEWSR